MNEMILTLQKLVSFETYGGSQVGYPYGRETNRAVRYILDLAKSFGFRTVRTDEYAYVEIGEGPDLIGVLAHIDVVPPGAGWTYDPFGKEITGDIQGDPSNARIYGRGTTDDKGPLVAVLYAMRDLIPEHPQSRIRLIIGQCEESGDWLDVQSYCAHEEIPSRGFTPDGDFPAISCEKGALVYRVSMPLQASGLTWARGGNAANMVPGSCVLQTVTGRYEGRGKVAHGCAPWLGENAISDAMKKAFAHGERAPMIRMYHDLIGNDIYGERLGVSCEDAESGRLSLNVGMISTALDAVEMMVDIRYPVTAEPAVVKKILEMRFSELGAGCQCVYEVEPLAMDPDSPVLRSLLDAYREVTHDRSQPISIGGGTYAKAMPNIVAFGPNFPGHENREHQNDEYITVADFRQLREIYRAALRNLTHDN